jgi:hypothetical protein
MGSLFHTHPSCHQARTRRQALSPRAVVPLRRRRLPEHRHQAPVQLEARLVVPLHEHDISFLEYPRGGPLPAVLRDVPSRLLVMGRG